VHLPPEIPEPNFEALRHKLSELRSERGWTYERLSELSGVSRATIVAIETGASRSRKPDAPSTRGSLESWHKLAHAFGMRTADLIRFVDE
jgi:DNA-binding XRE family transcriptional regulator